MAVGLDDVAIAAAITHLSGIVIKTGWDRGHKLLSWLGSGVTDTAF